MPLVNAKCTNCGANLKVDNNKDAAICEFCGSAFIVEKAINNYSITNNNEIHANIVNIYEGANCSHDFEITAGVLHAYKGSSVEVIVPNNVYEIGSSVFAGMTFLRKINLPSNLVKIGEGAFYGCSNLTSIKIPSSVTDIGAEAFAYCEKIENIEIPDGVKHIGHSAFNNCTSLTSLIIPDSVQIIDPLNSYDLWVGVVNNCSSLDYIEYPSMFRFDLFRGSLCYRRERQRIIDSGFCPDHNLALSFFKKKCPKCGTCYLWENH